MPRPWPKPGAEPAPRTIEQLQRSMAQRRRQAIGRNVEAIVEHRLRALGMCCVERINTGMRKLGDRFVHAKAVSGDFRAVLPPVGRSALIEVKHRDAERLAPSDIQPNQRAALDENARAGGLSLLVWARGAEIAVMYWPPAHFAGTPSSSLPWADARMLAITTPLARPR